MSSAVDRVGSRVHARAIAGQASTSASGPIALLGRILFSAIFLQAGPTHFMPQAIGYAASAGVPMANVAVPLSGMIAMVGGLSVALGYRARIGA